MSQGHTTPKTPPEPPVEGQRKDSDKTEQMCCDGKRTAAEHRSESTDGTCCTDS